MERQTFAFLGVAAIAVLIIGGASAYFAVASSGSAGSTTHPNSGPMIRVIFPGITNLEVSSSYDCVAGHSALNFSVADQSTLDGGFSARTPGVTVYVATNQQAASTFQGHPTTWIYSTGLVKSGQFNVVLSPGSYVIWIEGADLNCGSPVVAPLEMLTQVNITQAFTLTPS